MTMTLHRTAATAVLCLLVLAASGCARRATPIPFDPAFSAFNRTLAACVVEGQGVDYSALATNPEGLDQTRQMLRDLDRKTFDAMPLEGRMAVLINAHNLAALQMVSRHWPVKSIEKTRLLGSALDRTIIRTAGRGWSLRQLREAVMGDPYFEPRAIFLLNWAQAGCAPLAPVAVTGVNLKDLLELQTRRVLADERYCLYDRRDMTVYLTPLIHDYRSQFERDWATIWNLLDAYLPQPLARSAELRPPRLRWLDFDRSLNQVGSEE